MRHSETSPVETPVFPHDIRRIPGLAGIRRGAVIGWIRRLILLGSDISLIGLAWILAKNLGTPTQSFLSTRGFEVTLIPVLGISISIFAARKLYQPGAPRRDYLGVIKAQSLAVLLLLLTSYFFNPNQFLSRSHYFWYSGLSLIFLVVGRLVIDQGTKRLRLQGSIRYPAMVIADSDHQEKALSIVHREGRYEIAGVMDATALDRGCRDMTFSKLQQLGIAEVFVAWDAIKNRMFLGQWFQTLGITLRVIPVEENRVFGAANLHMLNDETPCITFFPPVIAGGEFWIKRLFDISASLLILTLASPIYIAIAISVFVDSPGPVFYKQTRIGLHGEAFKVWKFRSMVANADKLQAKLEQQNVTKDGVLFKIKDDPRITRVGHFIRQYSLDELPQIFNVLFGEMSLVGPRPLPLRDVEKFKQHYFIRQDVLPGITGMWQISGRSDIDNFDDVLKLDLYYIQNWSIWLDISILFQTLSAVLKKSGAY